MIVFGLILNAHNETPLAAAAAELPADRSIVFTRPGVGVYGPLGGRAIVKQPAGLSPRQARSAALRPLLAQFPDAARLLLFDGPGDPWEFSRSQAERLLESSRELAAVEPMTRDIAPPAECGEAPRKLDVYPDECAAADVLMIIVRQHCGAWWESRAVAVVDHLQAAGISAAAVAVRRRDAAVIAELLDQYRPRLVINRALVVQATEVAKLAAKYPATRFVSVNHSAYGAICDGLRAEVAAALEVARSVPNVYYATVDERNPAAKLHQAERFICLPNVVTLPPGRPSRGLHDPPVVSLICAPRDLKNLTTQFLAAAIAGRRRPLRLAVSFRGAEPAWLGPLATSFGLDAEFSTWRDWPAFLDHVADEVDVGLQCSFTESFNYVGIEHLVNGRPVVGSPALRYLPRHWQVNPDDADAIAGGILYQLDRWHENSEVARTIGRDVAARNNRRLIDQVAELLRF